MLLNILGLKNLELLLEMMLLIILAFSGFKKFDCQKRAKYVKR